MKKKATLWIIGLVVIILLVVVNNLIPLWASVLMIITFGLGGVFGWILSTIYDKYIREEVDK